MPSVAVASSCGLAAEAGARVADQGGNAVDAALAAALVSTVTEPGVCSLGGSAFLTIWPAGEQPVFIDGHVEMPGRGLPAGRLGGGGIPVLMEYGGGVSTTVGPGSVATPGLPAACELAWKRYGRLPWGEILGPAHEHARDGFPLSQPSFDYLIYSHQLVFGWDPQSYTTLHDADGRLLEIGASVHIEGLADSLQAVAEGGARAFYRGELAQRIVEGLASGGGILTAADLEAYDAATRTPLRSVVDGWEVATAPAPSLGGATVLALLALLEEHPTGGWSAAEIARLTQVQKAVFRCRQELAAETHDVGAEAERLLGAAGEKLRSALESPSTVHTSAVDSDGLACAITVSAGYGSGALPGGTGIWMNNCLGEIELNPDGLHTLPPGTRLRSNMAPTIARRDDEVLVIGWPGASRITSAITLVFLNHVRLGMPLAEAVDHPRLHVVTRDGEILVEYEEGLAVERLGAPLRRFSRSMHFGGVAAVLRDAAGSFSMAADPRRSGSTAIGGG